ncbi:aspartate aminotransferase family protein [Pandoraea sp. SD6-2]|uniref:aspartate aminotransferase family protein n=1 Tax=Pandoraea sp. SD6-2 TaxID=1286093 RepID=UPI00032E5B08|nr:glutamate-1-semialdehyde 2,1-aminomutase [Pandoraea sp. SD6-2]EON12906.1 glutamate-1-semialdehyde-2,1-aminomutase [Pandoraea sp. SD6-2]
MDYRLGSRIPRDSSRKLFARGQMLLPGGVSSPGRAFSEVDGGPLFINGGEGKYLIDEDGNRFVDFVCGLGPAILGHGHPEIQAAVNTQFAKGTVYGAPTRSEYALAERILQTIRGLDSVRFTCSGTEATMTALRIARAYTGRNGVIKIRGGYHGHSDALLSGASKPHMRAESASASTVRNGVDQVNAFSTFLAEFNDLASVQDAIAQADGSAAAIILEPVPSNMGVIPPMPGFLQGVRELATRSGIVLIFDEVVSAFRHRFGPVADSLEVMPDLITFGKIIGGGLPVGAFGGRKELMSLLVSKGSVFQGGTFAGSPLTMAAGLAQLEVLERDDVHVRICALADRLACLLRDGFHASGLKFGAQHFGSLVTPVLCDRPDGMKGYNDVSLQDKTVFRKIFADLLEAGFAIPPTIEEPFFISACHTESDVDSLACTFVESAVRHVLIEN